MKFGFFEKPQEAPKLTPEQIAAEKADIEAQLAELVSAWDKAYDSGASPDAVEDVRQSMHAREQALRNRLAELQAMETPT